jgi:hypothetical protein
VAVITNLLVQGTVCSKRSHHQGVQTERPQKTCDIVQEEDTVVVVLARYLYSFRYLLLLLVPGTLLTVVINVQTWIPL